MCVPNQFKNNYSCQNFTIISTKMVDNKPAYKPLQVQKILFSFIKVLYLREINHIIIIIIQFPIHVYGSSYVA